MKETKINNVADAREGLFPAAKRTLIKKERRRVRQGWRRRLHSGAERSDSEMLNVDTPMVFIQNR